jgi:hypothetical protein
MNVVVVVEKGGKNFSPKKKKRAARACLLCLLLFRDDSGVPKDVSVNSSQVNLEIRCVVYGCCSEADKDVPVCDGPFLLVERVCLLRMMQDQHYRRCGEMEIERRGAGGYPPCMLVVA